MTSKLFIENFGKLNFLISIQILHQQLIFSLQTNKNKNEGIEYLIYSVFHIYHIIVFSDATQKCIIFLIEVHLFGLFKENNWVNINFIQKSSIQFQS